MKIIISEKKVFKIIIIIICVLIFLSIFGQILKYFLGGGGLIDFINLFDVDIEYNIPTFFQAALLYFSALLIFFIIKSNSTRKNIPKHYWITLLVMCTYLGIDETVLIHENIMSAVVAKFFGWEMHGIFYYSWVIIGSIIAIILILYFTFLVIRIDKKIKSLLVISAFLYLFGAILMEMAGGFYIDKFGLTFTSQILVTIEEGAEMVGIAIFIKTLIKYINLKIDNANFNIIFK